MEAKNYVLGANNILLSDDVQIVQGIAGNACYLPIGKGELEISTGDLNEFAVSLWRKWDGVVENDVGAVRGIFSIKNIKFYFDNVTDFLTVELNDNPLLTVNVKDDLEFSHWVFNYGKDDKFSIFKNAEIVFEVETGNVPAELSEPFILGGGRTHATFDEVLMYKNKLKSSEVLGLYKLISKGTQISHIESIVASGTPKYLGVVETVPTTRTAFITKGERLGAVDANAGDWVLMSKTTDGWQMGVCYKWSGRKWEATSNPQQTVGCLEDALGLCKTAGKDEDIPAVSFTKKLVALEAFVENLSAQVIYFQKSVASLVSDNPKIGDQMIYLGHNYRQYNAEDAFSLGIDEITYKDDNIEVWRNLMNTKQIRNIAGASILSLFLSGCLQANGGVQMPAGSVISENLIDIQDKEVGAITTTNDGRAIATLLSSQGDYTNYQKYDTYFISKDRGRTFQRLYINNFKPSIYIATYENKFYAIKEGTKELWVSQDGTNWVKNKIQPDLTGGNDWYCTSQTSETLYCGNLKTGETIHIFGEEYPPTPPLPEDDDGGQPRYVSNSKIELVYYPYTQSNIKIKKNGEWVNASLTGGVIDNIYIDKVSIKTIECLNNVFYLTRFSRGSGGELWISSNGEDWSRIFKNTPIQTMCKTKNTIILLTPPLGDKNITKVFNIDSEEPLASFKFNGDTRNLEYNKELDVLFLTGYFSDTKMSYCYRIPCNIKTGSGITSLETTDTRLVAKFGNGLQVACYEDPANKPSFVGKEWGFVSGGNNLVVGRWF